MSPGMKKLFALPLALCICLLGYGQRADAWEVGLFLGQALYQGDIANRSVDFDNTNMGFGLTTRYNYYSNLKFRGNLLFSRLSGSDSNAESEGRRKRGITFQTSIIEVSGLVEWEPLGEMRELEGGKKKFFVSPYLMGGLGFAFINPKPQFPQLGSPDSQSPELRDLRAGYSKVHLAVPLGGGLRYDINRKWMIGAEIAGRLPFTDYLDGVSISGNPDKIDWYWFYGLTLMFKPGL